MPPSPGLALAWLRIIFRWPLNKCLNKCTHQCMDRSLANAVTLGRTLVICPTNCITPLQAGKSRGSFPPWIPGHPLKDHKGPPGEGASQQPWPGSWIAGCRPLWSHPSIWPSNFVARFYRPALAPEDGLCGFHRWAPCTQLPVGLGPWEAPAGD